MTMDGSLEQRPEDRDPTQIRMLTQDVTQDGTVLLRANDLVVLVDPDIDLTYTRHHYDNIADLSEDAPNVSHEENSLFAADAKQSDQVEEEDDDQIEDNEGSEKQVEGSENIIAVKWIDDTGYNY